MENIVTSDLEAYEQEQRAMINRNYVMHRLESYKTETDKYEYRIAGSLNAKLDVAMSKGYQVVQKPDGSPVSCQSGTDTMYLVRISKDRMNIRKKLKEEENSHYEKALRQGAYADSKGMSHSFVDEEEDIVVIKKK